MFALLPSYRLSSRLLMLAIIVAGAATFAQATLQDDAAQDRPAAVKKDALAMIQNMVIGEWRGVGQPRRGSSRGSWIETTNWSWKFGDEAASLAFKADESKMYVSGEIMAGAGSDDAPQQYTFIGVTEDGTEETFTGSRDEDGTLTFTSDEAADGRPARITLRNVADGDRLLVLYERQLSEDRYSRLVEVGYTRQGSGFGQGATAGPECVVTGGLGTIQVEHDGKTYFVCCSGCQDLFNEDPERILAEYAKRREEEKNKKSQDN